MFIQEHIPTIRKYTLRYLGVKNHAYNLFLIHLKKNNTNPANVNNEQETWVKGIGGVLLVFYFCKFLKLRPNEKFKERILLRL